MESRVVEVQRGRETTVTLDAQALTGGLIVHVRDHGENDIAVDLSLDGDPLGRSPWSGEVAVGSHRLGAVGVQRQVEVREGEVTKLVWTLPLGFLAVRLTDPAGAPIAADFSLHGSAQTPWVGRLPEGPYHLSIWDWGRDLEVRAGARLDLDFRVSGVDLGFQGMDQPLQLHWTSASSGHGLDELRMGSHWHAEHQIRARLADGEVVQGSWGRERYHGQAAGTQGELIQWDGEWDRGLSEILERIRESGDSAASTEIELTIGRGDQLVAHQHVRAVLEGRKDIPELIAKQDRAIGTHLPSAWDYKETPFILGFILAPIGMFGGMIWDFADADDGMTDPEKVGLSVGSCLLVPLNVYLLVPVQ